MRSQMAPPTLPVAKRIAAIAGENDALAILATAYALYAPTTGSTCVDLLRSTELPKDVNREALIESLRTSPLVQGPNDAGQSPFVLDGTVLYTSRYWTYQSQLASILESLAACPASSIHDQDLLDRGLNQIFKPSEEDTVDHQMVATLKALTSRLTIITGGPGVGKTWVVQNILALVYAQHASASEPLTVSLAAPTGKAALRMREAIRSGVNGGLKGQASTICGNKSEGEKLISWLSSLSATTIHRLLGSQRHDPTRFKHNHSNPLPCDVLIVDESSMIDLALMSKLLDAVGPHTKVILLGDPNQLASVEAGTVLADICAPKPQNTAEADDDSETNSVRSCIVTLHKSRRFSDTNRIGLFARRAISVPFSHQRTLAALTEPIDGENTCVLPHNKSGGLSSSALKLVANGYEECLSSLKNGDDYASHLLALNALNNFKVLAAHRKGSSGVEGLNTSIRQYLDNIGFVANAHNPYFVGLPIMVTQNDKGSKRFNGDIGLVVNHITRNGTAELAVAFLDNNPDDSKDGIGITYIPPYRLPKHQDAFAMTIHKSQGSEFEHVMIVLPTLPSPILTRELLYTGITRGRKSVVVVSDFDTIGQAIQRRVRRASGLSSHLR